MLLLTASEATADTPAGVVPGGMKDLATQYGLLGTLLAISITAIVTLFWLLLSQRDKFDLSKKDTKLEHQKELAEKDAGHAADRAEWHAEITLLNESRLSLMREVLGTINNATSVMSGLQNNTTERTQTAAELSAQVRNLVSAIQNMKDNTADEITSLRKLVRETNEEVSALGKRVQS